MIEQLAQEIAALRKRIADLEGLEIPQRTGCRVYNNANISINNNTATTLTFNNERDDPIGMHSTSVNTGRITIVVAGTYAIGCCVRFASNATGYRQVLIVKNGTTTIAQVIQNAVNGSVTIIALHTRYVFVAGDYIEIQVLQNSGGALNVDTAADYSPEFWAQLQP